MSDWVPYSVGDLCDAGIVELQTGPFGTQLHAHDYVSEGTPVVPTEALRGRQIDHSVLPRILPEKADELKRHQLRRGDILFARRGVQATGHIGYARDAESGFICGTGAIRMRVAENSTTMCPEFLSHVFANPASIRWFKFHAIGATMPNLNEGIIRSFRFSAPPLEEQKRIAAILSALDDKIYLNRQMNETLEAIAQAIFGDWFVDYGPPRVKTAGLPRYLSAEIWKLFPDTFDEGEKPSGWCHRSVSNAASQSKTSVSPSSFPDEVFDHYSIPAYDDGQMPTPQLGATILSNKTEVPPDAILISKLNPDIPRVWLTPRAGQHRQICSTEFLAFRANLEVSKAYLYLLFLDRSFRERLRGMVTGTSKSHQRVSPQNVLDAEIVLPPENSAILQVFEGLVNPLLSRVAHNRQESRTLAGLRDSLLPKLMTEEIRLKSADTPLGAA
jgi:type I restriction enzyme S subunit